MEILNAKVSESRTGTGNNQVTALDRIDFVRGAGRIPWN